MQKVFDLPHGKSSTVVVRGSYVAGSKAAGTNHLPIPLDCLWRATMSSG